MSPLQTIHQATCDRCKKVDFTSEGATVPPGWESLHIPAYSEQVLICGDCNLQLALFLNGAKLRKPRAPKAEAAATGEQA